MMTPQVRNGATRLQKSGRWLIGLLVLSGLIIVVIYFGEIESFIHLLQRTAPVWLIAGTFLQVGTYFSTAAVWYLAMRRAGIGFRMLPLVPLGVAKLFSDQALPSGGMSGTAFLITALRRRGVAPEICMAALLVGLVSYYAAYVLVAILSLGLLQFYHAMRGWIITIIALFCLSAVIIIAGTIWLRRRSEKPVPTWLKRIPGLNRLLDTIGDAPADLLHDPALLAQTTLIQLSIFILDSATLWVMLRAVGQEVSILTAFPSFVVASVVASLGLIPLGLGTFEATCVAILRALGVPLKAALTATLLLRGFTLWLPMAPGLWLARRELTVESGDNVN
ncbi:MAG: flippase-like domain-containing protein [Blastocatellia bacterium]|nr:flippase-like domain-containing protein [Blastocatellia bacterium]